jgi:hypothetical protein
VYAESMELFSLIINLVAELAKLARTLVAYGIRFMALIARSRTAFIADTEQSGTRGCISPGWRHGRFLT